MRSGARWCRSDLRAEPAFVEPSPCSAVFAFIGDAAQAQRSVGSALRCRGHDAIDRHRRQLRHRQAARLPGLVQFHRAGTDAGQHRARSEPLAGRIRFRRASIHREQGQWRMVTGHHAQHHHLGLHCTGDSSRTSGRLATASNIGRTGATAFASLAAAAGATADRVTPNRPPRPAAASPPAGSVCDCDPSACHPCSAPPPRSCPPTLAAVADAFVSSCRPTLAGIDPDRRQRRCSACRVVSPCWN